jgi:hypothetical protein
MKQLSPQEVHACKVAELRLDAFVPDLTAPEALAAALRRAAGFLCPCAAATLVRAVVRPLDGLVPDLASIQDSVEATLEDMVAYGDLIEQKDISSDGDEHCGVLLYAAPLSFLPRQSGAALLLGVSPGEISPLPEELEGRIEYVRHIRRIPPESAANIRPALLQFGLVELAFNAWAKAPRLETPGAHLAHLDRLLDDARPSMTIPGLIVLEPSRPPQYYRGRWVEPRAQTGRFIGRRSQAYGADLWCYVQAREGRPERFVDLPLPGSAARGCDEAWRIQMAIDAQRGTPQRYRLRLGRPDTQVLEFFSPIPMWAKRRWDAVGVPASNSSGCLFAYELPKDEISQEVQFIRQMLWLTELTPSDRQR